jgi:hypothetical protein
VLSCVGRGLGAGLIPRPKSLKGSISKKNPTPEKGIRNNEKEEEGLKNDYSCSKHVVSRGGQGMK